VRRHYADEYQPVVGPISAPREGFFDLPGGPGLGIDLLPAVLDRPDLVRRRTAL